MSNKIEILMDTVNQSVQRGITYFEKEGASSNVRIGLWEPREVLAHLVFWHEFVADALNANSSNSGPVRIHAPIDEMNARAIGRAANRSIQSMLVDIRNSNNRLNESAKQTSNPSDIIIIFPDGNEESVQQILESFVSKHWDAHISELKI